MVVGKDHVERQKGEKMICMMPLQEQCCKPECLKGKEEEKEMKM